MEFIKVNNVEYKCLHVSTHINNISFTIKKQEVDIQAIYDVFIKTTELTVYDENKNVYGMYSGIAFKSMLIDINGDITVNFHINSDIENKINELIKENEMLKETVDNILTEVIPSLSNV